jgi:hypothetical protein
MKGNSKMPNNLRFWAYVNGDWVKLTLRYGDTLYHYEGGATEEGYDHTETYWTHEGDHVLREYHRDARDCDGRICYQGDCHALATELRENVPHYWDDETPDPRVRFPEWREGMSQRRDYQAEAAGY